MINVNRRTLECLETRINNTIQAAHSIVGPKQEKANLVTLPFLLLQLPELFVEVLSLFGFRQDAAHGAVTPVEQDIGPGLGTTTPTSSLAFKWTAFMQRFSKQWPLKALYNYCLTFTHSYTHLHPDGGDSHAGRQPAGQERSGRGVCSGTPRYSTLGGAGGRTSNLPVTSQPALPPETHAAPLGPRPFICSQGNVTV